MTQVEDIVDLSIHQAVTVIKRGTTFLYELHQIKKPVFGDSYNGWLIWGLMSHQLLKSYGNGASVCSLIRQTGEAQDRFL